MNITQLRAGINDLLDQHLAYEGGLEQEVLDLQAALEAAVADDTADDATIADLSNQLSLLQIQHAQAVQERDAALANDLQDQALIEALQAQLAAAQADDEADDAMIADLQVLVDQLQQQWEDHMNSEHPEEPPPPTEDLGVNEGDNLVRFKRGTVVKERNLTGINIYRDFDNLVIYTRTSTQTVTPTNKYGVEVTVENGVVTAVVDRQSPAKDTGTPIPASVGAFVISGHAAAAPVYPDNTANWLLANVAVGDAVEVVKSTVTPPPPPPPPTGQEELYVWHYGWSDPGRAAIRYRDYPADVKSAVKVVCLGMSQSQQSGTGKLTDPPLVGNAYGSLTEVAEDAAALKANGGFWCAGFGGSGDGGIRITNNTQADEAVDSIKRLASSHKVNGVSIDLEGEPGTTWNQAALLRFVQRLKTEMPAPFFIDVCVGYYGARVPAWNAFMLAAGANVDRISLMLYDFPEAADSRIIAVTKDKLQTLKNAGVPLSKVVPLYAARPDAWGYANATPTSQLVADAVNQSRAQFGQDGYTGAYGWWDDRALKYQNPTFRMAKECLTKI